MSDVIQCPQCDKRFRLGDKVPATFTCTGCGTLMDLSDFGGAQAAPAPAAPASPRSGGARRSSARSGPRSGGARRSSGGRGGRAAPSRSGGRRGRAAPDDEYDDEPRGRRGRQQKSNGPLIIGSVAALVAAVILILIATKKDDDVPPAPTGTNSAAADATGTAGSTPNAGTPELTAGTTPDAGTQPAAGDAAEGDTEDDETVEPSAGGTAPAAAPTRKPASSGSGRYKGMSKVDLEIFPWAEDIDAETRAKAEEGIKAMYVGGRDWIDAEEWFVAQGPKLAGRLISEFKTIQDSPGLEDRLGKSYVGALDATLRKMDGWMERKWKELDPVRASSHPNYVLRSCQRWTWWWKYDEWKNNPRKVWDPFEDESDESETGIKGPEKKDDGKKGFGKRAGG
jgi:hypothetical protein